MESSVKKSSSVSSAISAKQVLRIAGLARTSLTEQEQGQFAIELSSIFAFFEQLNEVDTTDVAPVAGGSALENVVRNCDAQAASLDPALAERLLAMAPLRKDRFILVPAVFDEGGAGAPRDPSGNYISW